MQPLYLLYIYAILIPNWGKIALAKRLEKYKLKLNEEKTKVVRFSKKGFREGEEQEVFNFLGFTFYLGKSRKGNVIPKVKSCGKRILW